ncbi:MAG TPA: YqcC family protein [Arsenophonus apicola]|uniref:YqcC family protein n=1 Tax=Arsenophonus TaxID=637 RepID=UPI0015D68EFE|nr:MULTISPECIES: YqcC family protein [Arsenophonus]UBX29779.1 YqcC family protein [Arsenophonus apicola]
MNTNLIVIEKLRLIEAEMKNLNLWNNTPPSAEAFASHLPFAIDTMEAHEWLQWVLLPKLYKIIEQDIVLPNIFAITPYFEEIYKEQQEGRYCQLLEYLRALDKIFSQGNSTDA